MRRISALALLSFACALAGCGATTVDAKLPPPGVPGPLSFIVSEKDSGPVSLVFPGRSAPTDDVTLGIRETAIRIAERAGGSVALMSWKVYPQAKEWIKRQVAKRRASGERGRLALVGHSWGGQAAGAMATELLNENAVDEVSALVTIDAIKKGYLKCTLAWFLAFFSADSIDAMAFVDTPRPDGKRLKRHINYYQLSSPVLRGCPIDTADENHEVWFDYGDELGHGNLDNYICSLVAEDLRRAFMEGGE